MKFPFEPSTRKERVKYKTIESVIQAQKLFEGFNSENYLALDFTHKWLGDLWITKEEKRKIWHRRPYDSTSFRILVKALRVAGENDCFNKSMDKEEFKELVVKGDSHLYRGNVNNWLKRRPAKEIFEINGKIKLLYPLREIWGIED